MFIRRCLVLAFVAGCIAPAETTPLDHSATHAPEEDEPPGEGEPGPITDETDDTVEPCGGKGEQCCDAADMCPGNPVCKGGTCMVCCAVCKGGASSTPLDVDDDPYGCAEAVHDWCQSKCDNPPCVNHDRSGWKSSCS